MCTPLSFLGHQNITEILSVEHAIPRLEGEESISGYKWRGGERKMDGMRGSVEMAILYA